MKQKEIANWGNYPIIQTAFSEEQFYEDIKQRVEQEKKLIARGLGKCYGDASLGKTIFSTLKLDKILAFDKDSGIIKCQSGIELGNILEFIVSEGFFLPVTPGTKHITLGGAIASDVHGKNHHKNGSFSEFLKSFSILTEENDIIVCSKNENEELFWKTCGGMGLTGIILEATFQLTPIETSYISVKSVKTASIYETMEVLEKNGDYTYSVAWIDCLTSGKNMGRSLVSFGEHTELKNLPNNLSSKKLKVHSTKTKLKVPFYFPSFLLNNFTIACFNFLYYNKQLKKIKESIVHYDPFFYPLDVVLDWNKIYGKNGFLQYQFVIPKEKGHEIIPKILKYIVDSKQASFLSVLKLLGPKNKAVMGFPLEGYTLALDFKITDSIFPFLDKLDKIVLENDGKVYLAKDSRMSKKIFDEMYVTKIDSDKFESLQKERLS